MVIKCVDRVRFYIYIILLYNYYGLTLNNKLNYLLILIIFYIVINL